MWDFSLNFGILSLGMMTLLLPFCALRRSVHCLQSNGAKEFIFLLLLFVSLLVSHTGKCFSFRYCFRFILFKYVDLISLRLNDFIFSVFKKDFFYWQCICAMTQSMMVILFFEFLICSRTHLHTHWQWWTHASSGIVSEVRKRENNKNKNLKRRSWTMIRL